MADPKEEKPTELNSPELLEALNRLMGIPENSPNDLLQLLKLSSIKEDERPLIEKSFPRQQSFVREVESDLSN